METRTWKKAPSADGRAPSERCGHAATVAAHGRIYMFGGENDDGMLDDLYLLETANPGDDEEDDREIIFSSEYTAAVTGGGSAMGGSARARPSADEEGDGGLSALEMEKLQHSDHSVALTKIPVDPAKPPVRRISCLRWSRPVAVSSLAGGPEPAAEPGDSEGEGDDSDRASGGGDVCYQQDPCEAPCARAGHSVTAVGPLVIVFGGRGDGYALLNDVWAFDVDSLKWRCMASGPAAREGHTATEIDGRMFVFGGAGNGDHLNDLHVFDPENGDSGSWCSVSFSGTPPPPRKAHTATLFGDSLLIFGGEDSCGEACNDIYMFNIEKCCWSSPDISGPPPPPRFSHLASLAGKLVISGGQGARFLDDMWVLEETPDELAARLAAEEARRKRDKKRRAADEARRKAERKRLREEALAKLDREAKALADKQKAAKSAELAQFREAKFQAMEAERKEKAEAERRAREEAAAINRLRVGGGFDTEALSAHLKAQKESGAGTTAGAKAKTATGSVKKPVGAKKTVPGKGKLK